jgi:trimethylamine--corrinoid protein Co-methyltransferase
MINQCAELLTAEQVQRVHEASLEILERVGMLVRNEKARGILARHGCIVNKDTQVMQFPWEVVEEFRASIPPQSTFRGREACSVAGDRAA